MSNFDGYPIDLFEGKFTGSFDIPPEYGEGMVYGDVVAFVVVGTLGSANVKEAAGGNTKRVNSFKIGFAKPMTVDEAEDVRQAMGWESLYGEQLEMLPPPEAPKPVLTVKAPVVSTKPEPQPEPEPEYQPETVEEFVEGPATDPITYKDQALNSFLYPERARS